jgi:hypothetical protein
MPITSLRREQVAIKAAPFPIADLAVVAELYANASDALYLPSRTYGASNVSLRLDAPGLAPVDVVSWLPTAWLKPSSCEMVKNKKRLPAAKAPLVIDIANVSVTLEMAERLWPVLLHAATDLLVLGLGRDHPDYDVLVAPLVEFRPPRHDDPLPYARTIWEGVRWKAASWPRDADWWLYSLQEEMEKAAASTANRNATAQGGDSRLTLGLDAPTLEQLVEHRQGRWHTLPQALGSLDISAEALLQVAKIQRMVSGPWPYRWDEGLGVSKEEHNDLCTPAARRALKRFADGGRCQNEKYLDSRTRPYRSVLRGSRFHKRLVSMMDALCAAESFLHLITVPARQVKNKVAAAIEARGGLSLVERLAGYVQDGIARRIATLDRALDIIDQLRSAVVVQRRLIADMAETMQRVCTIQDGLRERIRDLQSNQSAWWRLEWDADGETATPAFTTFPAAQETIAQVRAARDRLAALEEHDRTTSYLNLAAEQLEEKLLDGWIERLGLAGLPREELGELDGADDW